MKTKREQILELLEEYEKHHILTKEDFADLILALPLKKPSDDDEWSVAAKWVIDEIIKLNQK